MAGVRGERTSRLTRNRVLSISDVPRGCRQRRRLVNRPALSISGALKDAMVYKRSPSISKTPARRRCRSRGAQGVCALKVSGPFNVGRRAVRFGACIAVALRRIRVDYDL